MRIICAQVCVFLSALWFNSTAVMAQDHDHAFDYYELSLLELSQIQVNIATGTEQSLRQAPAIVSVIHAQQIRQWNYQSVAQAINSQPGIYCIDDGLNHNCGVRGVNGGFQSYSKEFKVMINGQVSAFRSDGNNYLGPEFMAMEAIERIEIALGPGSALYGADAFLGVINIITKQPQRQLAAQINISSQYHNQYGGETVSLQLQHSNANPKAYFNSAYLSVQASNLDRSGYELPNSLPSRSLFIGTEKSQNDQHQPINAFLQIKKRSAQHTLTLHGHFSHLDGKASFVDFGRFSEEAQLGNDARIALNQHGFQLQDQWQINPSMNLDSAISYNKGQPSSDEKLDLGLEQVYYRRDFGYERLSAKINWAWAISQDQHLTLGLDRSSDNENLFESYEVDKTTGDHTLRSLSQGHLHFINNGLYSQYVSRLQNNWTLTANARVDEHNIYGSEENFRLASIFDFNGNLNSKLIYATSYKAPAAIQLYGQPLFDGEVRGDDQLKPERADTLELQLNWRGHGQKSASINVYQMCVEDKVELINSGANQEPQNQNTQKSLGVELNWTLPWQQHIFSGNLSHQESDIEALNIIGQTVTLGSDLYPESLFNGFWQYRFSRNSGVGLHLRYASERRASASNIELNGGQAYELGDYWLTHVSAYYRWQQLQLHMGIHNLWDEKYAEPGFNSVDLPGQRRTFSIKLSSQF